MIQTLESTVDLDELGLRIERTRRILVLDAMKRL